MIIITFHLKLIKLLLNLHDSVMKASLFPLPLVFVARREIHLTELILVKLGLPNISLVRLVNLQGVAPLISESKVPFRRLAEGINVRNWPCPVMICRCVQFL